MNAAPQKRSVFAQASLVLTLLTLALTCMIAAFLVWLKEIAAVFPFNFFIFLLAADILLSLVNLSVSSIAASRGSRLAIVGAGLSLLVLIIPIGIFLILVFI